MLFGRASELQYLNHSYDREDSQILVLYGQKHIGKTTLLREFSEDKPNHYYLARPCSEREQKRQWESQLHLQGYGEIIIQDFRDIFTAVCKRNDAGKTVIVIDEFQHIVKSCESFMSELVDFIHSTWENGSIMVLLCSSAIGWIENSMVNRIGEAAYEVSGFLKIGELPFNALTYHFPNFRIEECVEVYSILGGIPGLWLQFDDKLTIQQNICRKILNPDSFLFEEGERMVEGQLRETSVYNTILVSIAAGSHKLNDLYLNTGFSRSKISVYLKNLMEIGLVEKVFSYDTAGRENVQKGIYRIIHPFVDFYFTYMYPHLSELQTLSVGEYYNTYIYPGFRRYVSHYFKQVCRQHLKWMNEREKLPIHFTNSGIWVGKEGTIDAVAQDDEGKTLIALCNWERPMLTYGDYQGVLSCAEKAKIHADYVYLYTASSFDEKLNLEAKVKPGLKLVQISDI